MTKLSMAVATGVLILGGALGVEAQEHPLSLTLSGGVAGSLDEDDTGFSNSTFQLRFAVETGKDRNVGLRAGRMDFDDTEIGPAFDVTVDYLTISGEYIFKEPSYDSGLYLGLGLFDLASTRFDGKPGDESGVGLVVGALGEFRMAGRWFFYGEAAFAYTNLDIAQLYADLQVGIGVRF